MALAIAESERVRGITSPNPPVGCVILDENGNAAGFGGTQPVGGPHAEVMALKAAGSKAQGGTAVVTLEPCSHHGRTPPCVDALIEAGIKHVIHAVSDPNPRAAGGANRLKEAGITVESGLLATEVSRGPLRAWLHYARTGRPHVTWKYAASLDGRIAASDGTSQWISSETSRKEVHEMRAKLDAIIVGTGTVRKDDPALTARDIDGMPLPRQPLPVVVGMSDLPVGAKLQHTALHLRTHHPDDVLTALAGQGVVDVLLEGGPTLAGAFWRAGRIDRVLAYIAPVLLGDGPAAVLGAGVSTITDAVRLTVQDVTMSGPDVRISAVPEN
ncbi:bifunctional diaminohydroxyphosphoribosylaminopyrimidine deaminase/5-amino-6-(5-phosphoribosylamino)uracil reductase RibD [Lentzea sp. NBC_00516]|uniref:bifunctional diaminohydroxyphosphoribosylaminopyrimidine deaminase/5-amino-6-(5-phosphoribosylamino)uracil reductase RibD n=1 Tax=Lentzea sp. NBC_00516 TaxID=2903582 RepID=UPI002E80309E|nr:bifunctional diaminohydroxyphosphoribosylaminopyrimidine deaminase/5-amino-6-(5-phosphoribosylamino)uracil reductase RibD [Lentzea sp. NBC_00516]WUD29692.1 bifunctional diaminohydroxyphosphoribosylaminopyrimidine deaminase/5-amino-6-(5-phosphoribosylamino)uracil reductase RibD [Lentzea sp. NBC_00516]